jgi:hypothetical protein
MQLFVICDKGFSILESKTRKTVSKEEHKIGCVT